MLVSKLAKRSCLLLLLAIIAFYFYGLGYLPFVGPDEPRYAQVAREMLLGHDLITPTLGHHTWFEKPVLLYWMMGIGFRLFGFTEMAARLGPALCGVLTIVSVYHVGQRVRRVAGDPELNELGCLSALVVASMPGIIVFSRGASFDILVTMTLTWALGFFLLAQLEIEPKRRRLYLGGFYFFIGASLLAKGLIGIVLPLGVISLYQLFRRAWPERGLLKSLVWGIPIVAVVAGVWYVPVIARHGWQFVNEFFIQHHFARYISNKYHHPQPFYFYLLIIFPLALPWIIFTIDSLSKARNWNWRSSDAISQFRVFALAWVVAPLVFFSLSSSKLPGYILPVLPAMALISGERIARILARPQKLLALRVAAGILLVCAFGGLVYARVSSIVTMRCAFLIVLPLIMAGLMGLIQSGRNMANILLLAAAIPASFFFALNCDAPRLALARSTRHLVEAADARGYGSAPVYALHEIDRNLEFYAAGRVVYAADGEPVKFEWPGALAEALEGQTKPVLVIVPVRFRDQLNTLKGFRIEPIADNGEIAIVAVQRNN